jgi:hypothetical protein
MRIHQRLAVATVLACLAALVSGAAEPSPVPACMQFWPEARYRPYGYDHVVHITSACTVDARCLVSTDVDPEPMRVTVPSQAHIEVITRIASPASEFTPYVVCRVLP